MTTLDPTTLRNLAVSLSSCVLVARGEAHDAFDLLWKSGRMSRSTAYRWLAEQMRLPKDDCHMGKFTVSQCREVVRICKSVSA